MIQGEDNTNLGLFRYNIKTSKKKGGTVCDDMGYLYKSY